MIGAGIGATFGGMRSGVAIAALARNLTAANVVGLWLDPSDTDTLLQDAAGTTPVTAAGQTVGLILDKFTWNGKTVQQMKDQEGVTDVTLLPGHHASQSDAAKKPVYRRVNKDGGPANYDSTDLHYLELDGEDDFLSTAGIDFTGSDEMTAVAAVRKLSDAAVGMLLESSINANTSAGTFYAAAPYDTAAGSFGIASRGTAIAVKTIPGFPAPLTSVMTMQSDISMDHLGIRVDGVLEGSSAADLGTGNFGNHPLYIGMRGGTSLPFKGWLYGLFITGKVLTASQLSVAERHAGKKSARAIA